jgi:hypothetical protein
MHYFILLSLLCAATIHAADQAAPSISIPVHIFPENSKEFKPFEYTVLADANTSVPAAVRYIAEKHNLTVTAVYYYYPNNNKPMFIPRTCNYPLKQHQDHGAPLHISAKQNKAPSKSSNYFA